MAIIDYDDYVKAWHRKALLECASYALKAYARTKDELFLQEANWFKNKSNSL